jgi:multiple sugar transport system permease protein
MSARFASGARWLTIAVLAALFGFPLFWTLTMAFKPEAEWNPAGHPDWWPQHPTLHNFASVLGLQTPRDTQLLQQPSRSALGAIENSLIAAGAGTALALAVGILTAYGIARFRAGGRWLPFQILQLRLFPPIVLIIPLFFVWIELGLWGTIAGLAIIYGAITLPFVVWLTRSFLLEIPRETSEAAIADGCTHWSAFLKVMLPQMKGAIAAIALFVFILNWSDLLIALFMTDDSTQTAPVFLASLENDEFQRQFGPQAALAVILATPPVVIGVFAQRYLVRGLTFEAIRTRTSTQRAWLGDTRLYVGHPTNGGLVESNADGHAALAVSTDDEARE